MSPDRADTKTRTERASESVPIVALVLALAPALAVSPLLSSAVVLSLTVTITLVGCRLFIDASERWVPDHLSTSVYLVVATVLVTLIDILVRVYLPSIATSLGIAHPMMIVSCLILSRRRTAPRRQLTPADTLRTGLHFAAWLIGVSFVRELVGSGTVTLFAMGGFDGVLVVPVLSEHPLRMVARAPGGFLVLGYLVALRNARASRALSTDAPRSRDASAETVREEHR